MRQRGEQSAVELSPRGVVTFGIEGAHLAAHSGRRRRFWVETDDGHSWHQAQRFTKVEKSVDGVTPSSTRDEQRYVGLIDAEPNSGLEA